MTQLDINSNVFGASYDDMIDVVFHIEKIMHILKIHKATAIS